MSNSPPQPLRRNCWVRNLRALREYGRRGPKMQRPVGREFRSPVCHAPKLTACLAEEDLRKEFRADRTTALPRQGPARHPCSRLGHSMTRRSQSASFKGFSRKFSSRTQVRDPPQAVSLCPACLCSLCSYAGSRFLLCRRGLPCACACPFDGSDRCLLQP